LDAGAGDEAREAVQVAKLLGRWHLPIVTAFQSQGKTKSQAFFHSSEAFERENYPLDFTKNQKKRRKSKG